MAEPILMGRRTEHQLVCSTYRSRTKPTAQTNAAIRAANVTVFNIIRAFIYFNKQYTNREQKFVLSTNIQAPPPPTDIKYVLNF